MPLQDVPDVLYPEKAVLLRSWKELHVVETLDFAIAASVLHILAETVPIPVAGSSDIPPQIPDEPPSPCRPTAAHPRAYRGTKYKPPKTSKPEPVNLQLSLCSSAEENRVFARLAPYFEDGLKLLKTSLLSCGLASERLQMAAHCHENFLSLEYARSSTGRVVARQLLAIAEDQRLVCFEVYPASAKREVRQLFREYDLRLAQHLGIEICKGQSDADVDDYEIACPVSNRFWDDSAWDLEISDE